MSSRVLKTLREELANAQTNSIKVVNADLISFEST